MHNWIVMEITREIILDEIAVVSQELLNKARFDKQKIFWETVHEDGDGLRYLTSDNMYNGNAGIALFWLEYYHVLRQEKHLEIAVKTLKWIESYEGTGDVKYSLFTGKAGIIFLYCRFYEVTADGSYLDKALVIVREMQSALKTGKYAFKVNDLIAGTAGALVSVLYLYGLRNSGEVLCAIETLLDQILGSASYHTNGIYWDYSWNQVKGLCGMSHGVSGIAHAIQTAAYLFEAPGLDFACRSALAYEDSFYNEKRINWPDFRVGVYGNKYLLDHIANFRKKNIQLLLNGHDTKVWCHGSPGIAAVRLKHARYFHTQRYNKTLDDIFEDLASQIAVSKTLSYCHGLCGIADFLIDYSIDTEKTSIERVRELVLREYFSLANREKVRRLSGFIGSPLEDSSLMNGLAGFGHFLLRCCEPGKVTSFLAISPSKRLEGDDENRRYMRQKYSISSVKEMLIRGIMPEAKDFCLQHGFSLHSDLVTKSDQVFRVRKHPELRVARSRIGLLPADGESKARFNNVLVLEHSEVIMKSRVESAIYEYVRARANETIFQETDRFRWRDLVINRTSSALLIQTVEPLASPKDRRSYFTQFSGSMGAITMPVSNLVYIICKISEHPLSIGRMLTMLKEDYFQVDTFSEEQEEAILNLIAHLAGLGLFDVQREKESLPIENF